jgi:hypothetical protein
MIYKESNKFMNPMEQTRIKIVLHHYYDGAPLVKRELSAGMWGRVCVA